MATKVVRRDEILLNSVRYKLAGQVRPALASVLPGKVVTGDYSEDSEPTASTWIIDDQRGGLLVEEMDEAVNLDRYWWGTCDTRYVKEMTLGPLVASVSAPATTRVPTITNPNMELTTGWVGGSQSSAAPYSGTYAWEVSQVGIGTIEAYQDLSGYVAGGVYTFTCYVRGIAATGGGATVSILIDDGIGQTESTPTTSLTYSLHTVQRALASGATRLRLILRAVVPSGGINGGYFDVAAISQYPMTVGNPSLFANFNDNLWCSFGRVLAKLDTAAGASWLPVLYTGVTITDLVPTVNNIMVVGQGDSTYYWYINTSEVATQTNVSGVDKGVTWGSKFYAISTSGQLRYAAAPNSAAPVFTNDALLPLEARPAHKLFLYRNSSGVEIIYAPSTIGLYAHDSTNTQFLATELTLPDHPNGGKGACRWQDAAYVPAGLTVYKYAAASIATIQNVGLDKDDGLPNEYNAEIINLIPGHRHLYALLDSSQATGTSTSSLMSYDGGGWSTVIIDSTTEQTMTSGIESTVYAYRLWFIVNNITNYIPLQRGSTKPKKDSTYTYAASGVHITPWFDAGWKREDKVAVRLKLDVADASANETVVVKYRLNHATTAVASAWTTLGTITTNGETKYSFGSSAGVAFRDIQFRFDLARGSTNTNSPIIRSAVFSYIKKPKIAWGYRVDIDCRQEYDGRSPVDQIAALKTATEASTLLVFNYDGTDKYVEVKNISGQVTSGKRSDGMYSLLLIEV